MLAQPQQADAALDILCPMHLMLDGRGFIRHVGPTLAKLQSDPLDGARFFDVFYLIRPRHVKTMEQLLEHTGTSIHLRFRGDEGTGFKAALAMGSRSVLMNLSFGIGVQDAVAKYGLTNSDFAPTDLAVELLYVMEAKSAAMQESQRLNDTLLTARRAAEEQALTDALTGLPNRRAMDSSLSQIIREGVDFACMHLDLDKFKAVNDKFGHAAGDFILKNAGQILQEEIRTQDIVCRVGGDEFVLLFRGLTDPKKLEGIAKRIIKRFEMPIQFEGNICQISGSAGTTVSTFYNTLDPDEILRHADEALYASKNAGRGRHMFYAECLAIAR